MGKVCEAINHYKRKMERHPDDSQVLLHSLNKLNRVKVTIATLQETGIGKVVNALKKHEEDQVAEMAKELVLKWKDIVAKEEEEEEQQQQQELEDDESEQVNNHHHHHYQDNNNSQEEEVVDEAPPPSPPAPPSVNNHHHHGHKKHKKSHHRDREEKDKSGRRHKKSSKDKKDKRHHHNNHKEAKPSSSTSSSLPEGISPNYKPLPPRRTFDPNPPPQQQSRLKPKQTDDEALTALMALSKSSRGRTAVYSGAKRSTGYGSDGKVPSLQDICIRVLQDNVTAIEECGQLPFALLKPVLERASPEVLFRIESYNPYLIEDTGAFWERFVGKTFPRAEREEMETWRDMYERCQGEREAKLSQLTVKFKDSYEREKTQAKTTKLAYVGLNAKPPRNIRAAQARNGTAGGSRPGIMPVVTAPNPGSSSAVKKPKVAPMMAKTLKMARGMKSNFRR